MRNLYEQCLKLTQFAVLEFEQIFQLSQKRLKQALEAELIASEYTVQKQKGFLYAEGSSVLKKCGSGAADSGK